MGRHKDRAKEIIKNLGALNSEPDQLLARLDEVEKLCVEGYKQQRQTAKGTVVTLLERDLKTAVSCINAKSDIVRYLVALAESGEDDDRDYKFELHIVSKPQETPGDSEDF